jgi:peptidoglycan/LPS O-acetylase OafA/YrhL
MFVTAMVMAALVSTALAAAIYAWIETPARRIMVRWSGDVAGTSSRELPSRGH